VEVFVHTYIKLFFMLTPFFVITIFLALTHDCEERRKKKIALKVTGAVIVIAFSLYFCGRPMFSLFGITLDAFRIGAGALLFLSALSLVQGNAAGQNSSEGGDISVVPLALPVTVGPATTGALLIMGAETSGTTDRLWASGAILASILTIGALLYTAGAVERCLGQARLVILSKLTGLILSSIAAQMIFTGIRNLLKA
jgi:multiple antibiotic resistance protein